jgi:hypothetical protein
LHPVEIHLREVGSLDQIALEIMKLNRPPMKLSKIAEPKGRLEHSNQHEPAENCRDESHDVKRKRPDERPAVEAVEKYIVNLMLIPLDRVAEKCKTDPDQKSVEHEAARSFLVRPAHGSQCAPYYAGLKATPIIATISDVLLFQRSHEGIKG